MSKFIVLAMFLDQDGKTAKASQSSRVAADVQFLQWKEGYRVASRGNRDLVFTIKKIELPDSTGVMSYKASVELENEPGEETRVLRGSTLQSGYVFIDYGTVTEDEQKGTTKPIGVNVDKIRNFYPRKDGRPGCRIMLDAGVNYAVADAFDFVLSAVNAPDYEVTAYLSARRVDLAAGEQHDSTRLQNPDKPYDPNLNPG